MGANLVGDAEEGHKHALVNSLLPVPSQERNKHEVNTNEESHDNRDLDGHKLPVRLIDTDSSVPVERSPCLSQSHILRALSVDNRILVLGKKGGLDLGKARGEWDGEECGPGQPGEDGDSGLHHADTENKPILLIIAGGLVVALVIRLSILHVWHAWHQSQSNIGASNFSNSNQRRKTSNLLERSAEVLLAWETLIPWQWAGARDNDMHPSHSWNRHNSSRNNASNNEAEHGGEKHGELLEEDGVNNPHVPAAEAGGKTTDAAEVLDGGVQGGGDWCGSDEHGFATWCLGCWLGCWLGGWNGGVGWWGGGLLGWPDGLAQGDLIVGYGFDEDGGWGLDHGEDWDEAAVGVPSLPSVSICPNHA